MRAYLRMFTILSLGVIGCDTTTTIETRDSSCFALCLDAGAEVNAELELGAATHVTSALERIRGVMNLYVDGAASLGGLVDDLTTGDLSMPEGFSYEGDGVYTVDSGSGAIAKVLFYLPSKTSYGNAGEPIPFNLFDASNYFTGLKVSSGVEVGLSGVKTTFEFGFADSGPGAELLGLGASPKSPIDVNVGAMTAALVKTTSRADGSIQPEQGDVVQSFQVQSPPIDSKAVALEALALEVTQFSGENAEYEQELSFESSSLKLVDAGNEYSGDFTFSSMSPSFSFDALLRFDATATANVAFGCPGSTLSFPED